ncbi:unnamed protein product, partial [marine sediment metagenome]
MTEAEAKKYAELIASEMNREIIRLAHDAKEEGTIDAIRFAIVS